MNVKAKRAYINVLRENYLIELCNANYSTNLMDLVANSPKFFEAGIIGEDLHKILVLLSKKNTSKTEISKQFSLIRSKFTLPEFVLGARKLFFSLDCPEKSFMSSLTKIILLVINSYDEGRCLGISTSEGKVFTDNSLSALDLEIAAVMNLLRVDSRIKLPAVCNMDRGLVFNDLSHRDTLSAINEIARLEEKELKKYVFCFSQFMSKVSLQTAFREIENSDVGTYDGMLLAPLLVPEEFIPRSEKYLGISNMMIDLVSSDRLKNRKYLALNEYIELDVASALHSIKTLKFKEKHITSNLGSEHYIQIEYTLKSGFKRELIINMGSLKSTSSLWLYHTDLLAVLVVLEVLAPFNYDKFKLDKMDVASNHKDTDSIDLTIEELRIRQVQILASAARLAIETSRTEETNDLIKESGNKSKKGKKVKKTLFNKKGNLILNNLPSYSTLVTSKSYLKSDKDRNMSEQVFLFKTK